MQVLLRDVAARAGVSLATASRVLSGGRAGVSVQSREAVANAARELEYVPNVHAQALARAGGEHRDQGRHAAEAAIRMAALRAELA